MCQQVCTSSRARVVDQCALEGGLLRPLPTSKT